MNVIESDGLGKRYLRGKWALRDCTLGIPGGPDAAANGQSPGPEPFTAWLTQHGYTLWQSVQPDSRFWRFQLTEGGWLLGGSALLTGGSTWLVRRRGGQWPAAAKPADSVRHGQPERKAATSRPVLSGGTSVGRARERRPGRRSGRICPRPRVLADHTRSGGR